MRALSYLALVIATVAAFVFSSRWYMVFGKARMKLLGNNRDIDADVRRVRPGKILFEVIRSFVVVFVIAHLLERAGVFGWRDAAQFGLLLGIFPVMILSGSVLWDKRPWKLAAIHAGDWLLKILLVAVLLGVWR